MRQRKLGNRKHLDDVTLEGILDLVEVDLREVVAHGLCRGVVYEDVYCFELLNMFINSLLAKIPIAQVARNKQALLPFGLD
jgi:hypothetical protein